MQKLSLLTWRQPSAWINIEGREKTETCLDVSWELWRKESEGPIKFKGGTQAVGYYNIALKSSVDGEVPGIERLPHVHLHNTVLA